MGTVGSINIMTNLETCTSNSQVCLSRISWASWSRCALILISWWISTATRCTLQTSCSSSSSLLIRLTMTQVWVCLTLRSSGKVSSFKGDIISPNLTRVHPRSIIFKIQTPNEQLMTIKQETDSDSKQVSPSLPYAIHSPICKKTTKPRMLLRKTEANRQLRTMQGQRQLETRMKQWKDRLLKEEWLKKLMRLCLPTLLKRRSDLTLIVQTVLFNASTLTRVRPKQRLCMRSKDWRRRRGYKRQGSHS